MTNPTEFLSRTGYRLVTASVNAPITLSGDVSGTGTSGIVATLATVNSNVGSFTSANITVNAKGLITAASSGSSNDFTQTFMMMGG